NRINPVSQRIQEQFIPRPNAGSANSTFQNFSFLHPWPTDLYKWDGITTRVDYNLNSRTLIFGRFINRLTPYVLPGPFPELGTWTRDRNHYSTVLNVTRTFSPTFVNSAHWGWAKDYFIDGTQLDGYQPQMADAAISAIGLQGVNPQGFSVMGFPTIAIVGVQQLSSNVGGVNLNRNDHEISNNATWSVGRHVLKFGGEWRYFHDNPQAIPANTFGNFNFNGTYTGLGYSDFLLGVPFSSSRINALVDRTQTAYELGVYVQDTFKVSQKLTLDLGLRWDYFRHALYKDRLQFNWDRATGDVIVPTDMVDKVSPLYPRNIRVMGGDPFPRPARDNIRPRLGFAYRITEKFVFRGGYGQYTEALGALHRAQGTGPFVIGETYFNEVVDGRPFLTFPNPFPASLSSATVASQSISGYPRETDNGVIHQFNASLERQFAGNVGVRVSYIGSRSRGLNYTLQINKPEPSLTPFTAARRPYPQFVNAVTTLNDGRANYDAGQIEVQKRAGGVIMSAHYTLSNSMLDHANLDNPYNHKMWSRDAYNSRHRFVLNASYDLPFGRGRTWLSQSPRAVDAVLGGWQLGWITYLQSGQYFTPTFTGSDPSNTNTSGGLPDRIKDGNLPRSERSPDRWFDASAFVPPPPGRFGNSGVAILEGPGLNLHHLSAIKNFNLTERLRFALQANITNVFNRPHFDWPNANISVPASVGRVFQLREGGGGREMSGPRNIQFRFRIEF
ncbi:MAG TPA: TonB-dependent receptor, partial [Bryobacteraceae bacterium]|nr:TonB-dependent receptor [Bryobacteraceae bacterium]